MSKPVHFDHIEVHVQDIPRYCGFLETLFQGGRHKTIGDSGTAMFKTDDGLCIEVKKRGELAVPVQAGFCLPCVRMEDAEAFITGTLGLAVQKTSLNPAGKVVFFTDHEGIAWHIKEYLRQDDYTDW